MKNLKLGVASLCAVGCVSAGAAGEQFQIGGIVALSGPYGIMGQAMQKGVDLAVEMRGGRILNKPIVVKWEDSETKPQIAVEKATKLLSGGSDLLFGAVASGETVAVMKLAERQKVPLLVTTSASDDITGKLGNPYTFRTGNTVEMENRMMAEFASKTGLKKVYGVVADYAVGRQMWESLKAKLVAKGIAIAGEQFPAFGSTDYSLIINTVAGSGADGVALALTGNDALAFIKQAGQVNLGKNVSIFGTSIMDETMGAAVGQAGLGVNSTLRSHFRQDNAANRKFVEAYRKKYNEFPSQFAGEAYDGVNWVFDIMEKAGSVEPAVWMKAFKGSTYANSIEGPKHMRTCDNQAEQAGVFGKAVKGTSPYPDVTMEITATFPAEVIFDKCR